MSKICFEESHDFTYSVMAVKLAGNNNKATPAAGSSYTPEAIALISDS